MSIGMYGGLGSLGQRRLSNMHSCSTPISRLTGPNSSEDHRRTGEGAGTHVEESTSFTMMLPMGLNLHWREGKENNLSHPLAIDCGASCMFRAAHRPFFNTKLLDMNFAKKTDIFSSPLLASFFLYNLLRRSEVYQSRRNVQKHLRRCDGPVEISSSSPAYAYLLFPQQQNNFVKKSPSPSASAFWIMIAVVSYLLPDFPGATTHCCTYHPKRKGGEGILVQSFTLFTFAVYTVGDCYPEKAIYILG